MNICFPTDTATTGNPEDGNSHNIKLCAIYAKLLHAANLWLARGVMATISCSKRDNFYSLVTHVHQWSVLPIGACTISLQN